MLTEKFLSANKMINALEKLTKDLIFISETDSLVLPVELSRATEVSAEELARLAHIDRSMNIEEIPLERFFARLTKKEEWHGSREIERAKRFVKLEKHLHESLRDIKVFKVGRVQREIFVVGLDADDRLSGIRTKSVET